MLLGLRMPWLALARKPSLRVIVAAGLGVLLGMVVAGAPAVFLLAAGLLLLLATIFVNLWLGFLFVGAYLVVQAPLQELFESVPELDVPLRYSDDALIALLALGAVWSARYRIPRIRHLLLPLIGVAIALGLGLAAGLNHGSSYKAILLDAFSLSKWALLLFTGFQLEASGERLLRILRGCTIVAILLAGFGYLDLLFPTLTHETIPIAGPIATRMGFRCLVSVFPNEGQSGWFFAAMACLPAAGYLVQRRSADLASAVFLLLTSFFSYRRKPVVGIAFALGVLMLSRADLRWRHRILAAAALTAIVAFPILGGAFQSIFLETYEQYVAPADPTQVARNAMYIVSWRISKDYFPLGAGLGLFGGHASMIEYSSFYARYGLDRVWGLAAASSGSPTFVMDVFFPHVLGSLGLLGALLYIVGLLAPGWRLFRVSGTVATPAARIAGTAALLVFAEALAESIASPLYETSLTAFVVFGLAGIALATALGADPAAEGRSPGIPPRSGRAL